MTEAEKVMFEGCHVCLGKEAPYKNNTFVYCDGQGCGLVVHQRCYGISSVPKGEWFCKPCEENVDPSSLKCRLCPLKGGAMKRIKGGADWSHIVCALYFSEVTFDDVNRMEGIKIEGIPKNKYNLECYICNRAFGACIKCHHKGCDKSMHATCAHIGGYLKEVDKRDYIDYRGYCDLHLPKGKHT